MTSTQFSRFWTPSPLICILARSIVLNSCNLPYYVCIWATPSPLSVQTFFKYGPLPCSAFQLTSCIDIISFGNTLQETGESSALVSLSPLEFCQRETYLYWQNDKMMARYSPSRWNFIVERWQPFIALNLCFISLQYRSAWFVVAPLALTNCRACTTVSCW